MVKLDTTDEVLGRQLTLVGRERVCSVSKGVRIPAPPTGNRPHYFRSAYITAGLGYHVRRAQRKVVDHGTD
jgi:hypothetical protein